MANNKNAVPAWKELFDLNVTEDENDILTIGNLASKEIFKRFNMDITKPEIVIDIYCLIFSTIQDKILEQEKTRKSFKLNLANRLEIGFDTREDDEDEKVGNYNVFIRHLENKKKQEIDSDETKTIELCTQWNSENIIYQTEFIKEVSIASLDLLKKAIGVHFSSEEVIMPIFITIHEQLVSYLHIKRAEENVFEYEINFAGCFFVGARETVDSLDDIYFRPNIESKLTFKNDQGASSKHE